MYRRDEEECGELKGGKQSRGDARNTAIPVCACVLCVCVLCVFGVPTRASFDLSQCRPTYSAHISPLSSQYQYQYHYQLDSLVVT